jgi:hypothetical protein
MAAVAPVTTGQRPNVCQRVVLKTNPRSDKTECVLTDGTSILLSNFLASFIRAGDELWFPLALAAHGFGTGGKCLLINKLPGPRCLVDFVI